MSNADWPEDMVQRTKLNWGSMAPVVVFIVAWTQVGEFAE